MSEVIWHDVECGAYAADLKLWEGLAGEADGPILEMGCGTGRVALHLARQGQEVTGLDIDPVLAGAFDERARGLPAVAAVADAREMDLGRSFTLILAPMQTIQLLDGREERLACLFRVAECLALGGRAAFAIVEEMPTVPPEEAAPALPDVRQVEDWVYSSLPLAPEVGEETIVLRRLRQTVAPTGKMSEELNEIELQQLSAETLEQEAVEVGLRPLGRREIPATEAHVGSTVVLLEKGS